MATPLAALQGEVHRFTGVIDRFGSFPTAENVVRTVCVRDLRLADCNRPVTPDHWWFPLRQIWENLNLQPGDEVLFTTKIQRCTKGFQPAANNIVTLSKKNSPLRTAYGPGREPRSVVILRRAEVAEREPADPKLQVYEQIEAEDRVKSQFIGVIDRLEGTIRELKSELGVRQQELSNTQVEVIQLSQEKQRLCQTVQQLEQQVSGSISRQGAAALLSLSILLALFTGFGMGAQPTRSPAR